MAIPFAVKKVRASACFFLFDSPLNVRMKNLCKRSLNARTGRITAWCLRSSERAHRVETVKLDINMI